MKFFVKYILLLLISTKVFSNEILQNTSPPTIAFKENKGQVSDQFYKPRPDILFSGTDGQLNFHLKTNGISYQLSRVDSWKKDNSPKKGALVKDKEPELVPDKLTIYRLDVNWLGSNEHASIKKGEALEGYDNYYSEVCPNGALEVKSYKQIVYQNIYKGIDLKWYEKNGNLKYDYIVSVGSDYKEIQLEINGAEKISLNKKGELIIKTPLGEIIEQAPYVTQNGKQLVAKWFIKNNIVSFDIKNSDPTQTLIIDPLIRLWGTYYGGSNQDDSYYTVCDASNNVFITGRSSSNSTANIVTVGSFQTSYGGPGPFSWQGDAFIAKFNASGLRLWGTYFGGLGSDLGNGCNVDALGNVYIGGVTSTSNAAVMTTPGAHQVFYGGSFANSWGDGFIAKFNSTGFRVWSSYYGGTGDEWIQGISVDAGNNIYFSGQTTSTNNISIAAPGSHQSICNGNTDGFLVKFNSAGTRIWGTYYGGNSLDNGLGNTLDAGGNVYLFGQTSSTNAISTAGAHQPILNGQIDGYIARFNSSGVRLWSTYYGDAGNDYVYNGVTDAAGNLYAGGAVAAPASGGTVIATPASHQPLYGGGSYDCFLIKFDQSGVRIWGTYYGGTGNDEIGFCSVDPTGNIYMAGQTTTGSGTSIATPCAYQQVNGGSTDAFLVKFTPSGNRLWGTYYGGSGLEEWATPGCDGLGNVYITGRTSTSGNTIIASSSAHQPLHGGGYYDGFLVKFDGCIPVSPLNTTAINNMSICPTLSTSLTTSLNCGVSWFASPTGTLAIGTGSIFSTPPLTANTFFYIEESSCGMAAPRTVVEVTVTPLLPINISSSNSVICQGQSATLTASGANSYSWTAAPSLNSTTNFSVIASPTINSTYSVSGNSGACTISGSINIQVIPTPTLEILSTNHFICIGTAIPMSVTGAQNYTWSPSSSLTSPTGSLVYASPQVSTTYTVLGSTTAGTVSCTSQNTYYVQALVTPQATVGANVVVCEGNEAVLFVNGGNTYEWLPSFNSSDPTKNYVYVKPLVNTIYTVNVSNDGYCVTSKTVAVTVNPKPTVFAGRDTVFNLNEPMYLTATGTGSLTWISGEVYCNDCIRTQIFPTRYSCYVLQGINEYGCEAKDEVCVDVGTANGLYVPNSFTPNNDGLNDILYVYGFGITKMNLEIFDRWGNKVFKTSDQTTGWNGTFNGSACKEEVYVYRLEYKLNDYKSAVLTGHINLLR